MVITFLTLRKYLNPVRHLADFISTNSNEEIGTVILWPEGGATDPSHVPEDTSLLIRYGYVGAAHCDELGYAVLNRATSIQQSSQKYSSLLQMERAGIPVPPHATALEYISSLSIQEDFGLPVIGRKYTHFGGKDLRLVFHKHNLPVNRRYPRKRSDYILKFFPHTKEYRVWTFNTANHYRQDRGRVSVIKTAEKVDNGTIDRSTQQLRNQIIKNRHNQYVYQHADNIPDRVRELGALATTCFHLDFAAVDVIEDTDMGNFYVLEVNTAPGMSSPSSIRLLGERFIRTVKHKCLTQ